MKNKTYTWNTASIVKETEDVVTIIFETNGHGFNYKPGQFVNLRQVVGEEAVSRSYSLSSSADEDERPAITIKKVEGGIMSNYVFHHAEEIKQWEVDGPHGSFFADPQLLNDKPIVLIGGGSGITPLYSILKTFLKHSHAIIFLIDCNRTWNDVVFVKSLTYLEQVYADRLQVHHFLSREKEKNDFQGRNIKTEKLNKLVLKKTLKKLLAEMITEAEYFLCGPNGLIKLSKEALESLEIPADKIHTEYFSPTDEENVVFELPQTTKEVLINYYDQTNLLEVQPGKTILETALEDKIPLNYSCKNGTCGKCVAKQTAGKVHMAKNYALTEDEVNQGFVLLCQSHPLNDEVIITIE
ncbi:MAG TPA: iron-sulfur cluster-binding domain-containing protein [Flavisolibacter sp.]|jgi:ring-1,2-phenylacetyl-CoA epoxidase subunit PaaE|nr:iron-sulfur cluster-binding domain-containing protein [Flavisolibacter sp.]